MKTSKDEMRRSQTPTADDTRILIVDDHRIFADLLEFALNCEPGLSCVGKATSPEQARLLFAQLQPDAVVMDLQLGPSGNEGIELTREFVQTDPRVRILVLTAQKDHPLAIHATRAGAVAFLQKDGSSQLIIRALKAAHDGYLMISPPLFDEIGRDLEQDTPFRTAPSISLTSREHDVLRLLGTGLRPNQVAMQLGISSHTVRSHLSALKRKLDTHTQLQTVTRALALGLLANLEEADPTE